jgi:hypothetical protein
MKKGQKYLVVIRPAKHKHGEGLTEDERLRVKACCQSMNSNIHGGKKVVFSAPTRCSQETAQIISSKLNTGMFITANALESSGRHKSSVKNKEALKAFLRSYQREFDVMVIVTHVGHDYEDETFLMSHLEKWLGWETTSTISIDCALIIEYQA